MLHSSNLSPLLTPQRNAGVVNTMIGLAWSSADKDTKQEYEERARADKIRYLQVSILTHSEQVSVLSGSYT